MSDINEKIDKKKDSLKSKSIRKKSIKSSKNKENKENAKNDNVMLTKIEEFIEIDKNNKNFKDETCILKNLNQLFLNENEGGGNNLIGYTIDDKKNTIIKFNRSPSSLAIEKFRFPTKEKEKEKEKNDNVQISNKKNEMKSKSKKRSALIYRKNFIDKNEENNMTENADNKENIDLMKKFKDSYESDDDEESKNKKMNSNVTRKFSKNTREHTMLVRHSDLKKVLEFEQNTKPLMKAAKELKSKRKQKSKKDEKIKKEEKSPCEENIKNKEKDDLIQDNNNYIIPKRRENKSKTRKQRRVSFHCGNFQKNMIKEINQNYLINNNNIQKLEINKKSENDEEKENKSFVRKRSKSKHINRKASLHNYHFDFDKGLKLKRPKDSKSKLFQSVLFPKKSSLLEPKNKEKEKEENDESSYYINNNDKSKINNSSSSDSKKTAKKTKSKKKKNQMNLKLHKKESNKNVYHSIITSNNSNLLLNYSSQIKSNNYYRNNIKNLFEYKMKHVNHFCIKSLNKINGNKSSIIRLPFFSVVKPDKLVSIEYTRAYENNNRSFCLNKISEDKLTIEHKNNDRNENEGYKVEKRNKSFFCCL